LYVLYNITTIKNINNSILCNIKKYSILKSLKSLLNRVILNTKIFSSNKNCHRMIHLGNIRFNSTEDNHYVLILIYVHQLLMNRSDIQIIIDATHTFKQHFNVEYAFQLS